MGADPPPSPSAPAPGPDANADQPLVFEQLLVTPVPLWMTVEKLRGFVADHGAKIVKVDGNFVQLLVEGYSSSQMRRATDRPTVFRVEVRLDEEQTVAKDDCDAGPSGWARTRIRVTVAPEKNRERRREEVAHRAKEVLVSFRSYLMANQEDAGLPAAVLSDRR